MSDKKLDRLLAKAKKAYRERDKSTGARLVDEVLRKNFSYPPAWELLYRIYGTGKPFETFLFEFITAYYPNQIDHLQEIAATGEPTSIPGEDDVQALLEDTAPRTVQPPDTSAIPKPTPAKRVRQPQPHDSAEKAKKAEGGEKIRVLVVDDIAETRTSILRTLKFLPEIEVVGAAENGAQAIQLALETQPDVVLMDVNMPDMDGIRATGHIRQRLTHTQVIILTVQDDADYIRRAMLAGARDFLTKPPVIDDLLETIQKAAQIAWKKKAEQSASLPVDGGLPPGSKGQVITVYSPRGAAGASAICANLAVNLCNEETRLVIVDGNLAFGDMPIIFNLRGRNTILDLAPRAAELDPEVLDEVVLKHASGVHILAPLHPEDAAGVSGEQFGQILNYLKTQYVYVLVDTTSWLDDITLAALDASDLVLLVGLQEVPAIERTRKFLELAPLINLDKEALLLLINRFDKNLPLPVESIEQSLRHKVALCIPDQPEVVTASINRGEPFMSQRSNLGKPVGEAMLALAREVRQRLAEHAQRSLAD